MAPSIVVVAHVGHWLEGAFFAPPLVLVLVAIVRSLRSAPIRDRPQEGRHDVRE